MKNTNTMTKKTTQLKEIFTSKSLDFLMEAHDGVSAKIVEETGFKGIWGSGLTISASFGARDNNEASWTQILDKLEFMSDIVSVPILLDGDTGYGNFNNFRRLIRKLEQRDISGVCIEDKLFPKTNSFIGGEKQPLADVEEFCGKIKAGKDTQKDADFCIVARVEAFIAGWHVDEAIRRADAYRLAGADAILIHSKKSTDEDIEAFMAEWDNRHPVVIVPTKYYSTPTRKFEKMGIQTVIWANQNLRSAVTAMQETSRKIYTGRTLRDVEPEIASVSEIFRLQNAEELKIAEKRYLPASDKTINAIVLAAAQGSLGELTLNVPKTLLNIQGKSILRTQINSFLNMGIKDITIVRGFNKETIVEPNANYIDNDEYAETSELYSLYLAREQIKEDTIISYGDIIYKEYILLDLISSTHEGILVVDADYESTEEKQDFVRTDQAYSKSLFGRKVKLTGISNSMKEDQVNGEFIGLFRLSGQILEAFKEELEVASLRPDFKTIKLVDFMNNFIRKQTLYVNFIRGAWLDINTIVDLQKADSLYSSPQYERSKSFYEK